MRGISDKQATPDLPFRGDPRAKRVDRMAFKARLFWGDPTGKALPDLRLVKGVRVFRVEAEFPSPVGPGPAHISGRRVGITVLD